MREIAAGTACGDSGESTLVSPHQPSLATSASPPAYLRTARRVRAAGQSIYDSARLDDGFAPTGHITFDLYGPGGARREPGYTFSRIQWLRRADKVVEAGQLLVSAPRDPAKIVDVDQWWIERRIVARKLLDLGNPRLAYDVVNSAASPKDENYRADQHFTAGWIALRFLHDPKTASAHFAHVLEGTHNPHALSRGGYWQGRAAEALGDHAQAKRYYELAARYTATYYGQLARARLRT